LFWGVIFLFQWFCLIFQWGKHGFLECLNNMVPDIRELTFAWIYLALPGHQPSSATALPEGLGMKHGEAQIKDKPVSGILESRRWNDCWRHAAINVSPIYINCSKSNWSCHFDRWEETQCHSKTGCLVEWVTSMFKGNYHFKFLTKKMGSSKFRSTINLSLTLFVSVVHAWLR